MAQNTTNQQHTRKYGGTSSFVDESGPSQAPRQDEQGQEATGSTARSPHAVDPQDEKQGISNRPVKEEHAFPQPGTQSDDAPDSVETPSKQQGGSRGRV
jgi:hypothetical protein